MTTQPKKETTALAVPAQVGQSEEAELAIAKDVGGVKFLQLMQGKSGPVEENEPEGIRAGDFLLGRRTRLPTFQAVIGITRPRAILFENNAITVDSYDAKSADYNKVAGLLAGKHKGAKVGLEVLLWLPEHGLHATLGYMNSARDEIPALLKARKEKKLVIFSGKLVGKKNRFFVPKVKAVEGNEVVKLPTPEQAQAALAWFENYKNEKPAPPPAENARPR